MRILLYNNGSKYLEKLQSLLKEAGEIFIKDNLDTQVIPENYDLVVLSGGHNCSVVGNENYYQKEIEFLKKCNVSTLGICLGAELIAFTFGAKLEHLSEGKKGFVDIEILKQDTIFDGIQGFRVFESHKWAITGLSEDLVGLARSKDGFEVIKHKSLPLYGFQFHPELFKDKTVGEKIFNNLFNLLKTKVSPHTFKVSA